MATKEMSRFTAWLSEAERAALDKAATEQNTSINFIVRTAVRQWLIRRGYLSPRVTNSA